MSRHKQLTLNLVAILIVLVFLFPVYWMFITSIKTQSEIFQFPPTYWPHHIDGKGYADIFSSGVYRNLFNSLLISFFSMIIVIVLSVPAAYGLARFRVSGMKLFILFFLVTQMLPPTVILTPLFIVFSKLGILNSYLGPILATATLGIPFSVLVLRTYFLGIPKELEEAAQIDGCSRIFSFVRIILPIAFPGIIVSAAISFLFSWGDLIYSLTFNRDQALWPLTASIYNAIGRYGIQWNSLMAFATITVLPVLILFILLQKQIVKGLTAGAIK
ncbi:multiple sugar transport system permease protein [Caldalkalibacillus uzonensis]|uniref:Multiple sugar transport system permease protein n=1 Tax=Caldalkalibacillus uzonensis TaxID=353224 RepID=A0ABU0CR83_9BACI|nr:carbohydrate ABC transporter permease [Caldalkalibacillus uzonensis]MDQ0338583.1 multiple sugar transport system permease protein [Caldalkalibacillus uzonensis]